MTDEEKLALARRFLSVLRQPDPETVKSTAVADVVWSFPGKGVVSGEAHGVDGVIARAKIIAAHAVNVELVRAVYSLDGVALILHNTASRDGHAFDEHIAAVFRFRDGKVARLDTHLSDVAMADAFFVKAGAPN